MELVLTSSIERNRLCGGRSLGGLHRIEVDIVDRGGTADRREAERDRSGQQWKNPAQHSDQGRGLPRPTRRDRATVEDSEQARQQASIDDLHLYARSGVAPGQET